MFARSRQNALIWARGVLVAVGVSCIYAAFRFISLSDGMALFHTRPFVVGVICWIWLGERFTGVQIAASGEVAWSLSVTPNIPRSGRDMGPGEDISWAKS